LSTHASLSPSRRGISTRTFLCVGRELLELKRTDRLKEFGCNNIGQYAECKHGIPEREARANFDSGQNLPCGSYHPILLESSRSRPRHLVDWAHSVSYNEQVKQNLSDRLRAEIVPAATCTPGQRLLQCIELAEAGLAMKKAQLARLFPDDTETERAERFQEWLLHREDAPWGDAEGSPVQRAF
jgi:hypothetical protein